MVNFYEAKMIRKHHLTFEPTQSCWFIFAKYQTRLNLLNMDFAVLFSILGLASAIHSVYPPEDVTNDSRVDLYLGLIMSFGNTFNSSGTVPAVQIALDLINDHPTLLPNYKLHYQLTDSQVSAVSTLYKFCFHVVLLCMHNLKYLC